jgi:hypothetical protein
MNKRRIIGFKQTVFWAQTIALSVVFSTSIYADHSWNDYHWASISKPITLQVVDSATQEWDMQLNEALNRWSQSIALEPTVTSYDDKVKTRKDCPMVNGQLRVCNYAYGITGWLGQTVIGFDRNGHIDKARSRLNDSYSQYWTSEKKNHIMCHELGHVFGLWHTSEDGSSQQSCMDLSNDPASQWPNRHDYVQLLKIYAGKHFYNSYDDGAGGQTLDSQGSIVEPAKGERVLRGPNHEVWVAPREDGGYWVHHIVLAPEQ